MMYEAYGQCVEDREIFQYSLETAFYGKDFLQYAEELIEEKLSLELSHPECDQDT